MNRIGLAVVGLLLGWVCKAQTDSRIVVRGSYSFSDSVQLIAAYHRASQSVDSMLAHMNYIWNVKANEIEDKRIARERRWLANESFNQWLGSPGKIRMVKRRISKIHSKFDQRTTLEVRKENRGKCTGWISAWTIPFGKVHIRLCEDFFIYRTHLQEKVLIHEMGHESGLLFHRKIHGCRAARRAAASDKHTAKRSTENYAWLAMSFLGLKCSR